MLAQAACEEHSEHLLYPIVKKLPTGLYSHHLNPLDLDDAAPLLSALPFGRVDPVSTVDPPAQGRHVEDNEQHNHDE